MNSKLLFNLFPASRCCFLALCLLLSSGVANADQAADVAAILALLTANVTVNNNGFYTVPLDTDDPEYYLSELLEYNDRTVADWQYETVAKLNQGLFRGQGSSPAPYLSLILAELQKQNPQAATNLLFDIYDFLNQSTSSEYEQWGTWRADWDEVYGSALRNLNRNIDFVTFDSWSQVGSGSPVLSVYDEPASAKLLTLLRLLQDDVIPALQSIDGSSASQSSNFESMGESIKEAIENLNLTIQGISEDWLTLDQLEKRDQERDSDLRQDGESSAREAQDSLAHDEREYQGDAQSDVENYRQASEDLVETQDFDFDMETENPYDEFDTLSKDAKDKFKEIVGDAKDYTYSGPDDLVLLDTPALDYELFPGLGIVKYNYTLHHGLRNWSQQSRRITSWAWRLLGFSMQLALIVRFIVGAMSGFSYSEKKTSDF